MISGKVNGLVKQKVFQWDIGGTLVIAKVNDAFDFAPIITNVIAGRRFDTFNILMSSRIPRQIIFFPSRQTAMQSSAMKNEGLNFQSSLGYRFESLLF